jgi:hypothetical protein
VKALFLKARDQLSQGGLFIFDSQPWKSYKKAGGKQKTKEGQASAKSSEIDNIQLKPHCFKAYLKAIGFRLLLTIDDRALASGTGNAQ